MPEPIDPSTQWLMRLALPLKAVRINTCDDRGGRLRTASGFIRRESDGLFLYTCWHVVTGICRYPLLVPPTWQKPVKLLVHLQNYASALGGRC